MRLLFFLLAPQILGPILTDKPSAVSYYCRSISVKSGQITGTLTNFPLLFSGTFSYLAHTSSGGKVVNANGYDIRFYPSSDCSGTKLDYEIEKWVDTTGEIVAWMKIASAAVGTVGSVRYGEAGITTDQSNPTGVWDSNYKGVWHVPDGTTLSLTDSTSIGSTLTNSSATAGAGKIDGGAVLGGTAYLSATTNLTEYDPSTAFTFTGWVYLDSSGWNDPDGGWFGKNSTTGYMVLATANSAGGTLYINGSARGTVSASSADAWHYFALVWDGSDYKWYWDGSGTATITYTSSTAPNSAGADLLLGAYATNRRMKGKIDEYRYSNIARSTNWLTGEYNNQSSPADFHEVGTEIPH